MQYCILVGSIIWISSIDANGTTDCVVSQHDVSVVVMNSPSITTSLLEHKPPQLCSDDNSIRLAIAMGLEGVDGLENVSFSVMNGGCLKVNA